MLLKFARFLSGNLPWLIIIAGVLGYILNPIANFLSSSTPYLLAAMMIGSGLTLSLVEVLDWKNTIRLTLITLALQLSLLPLLGWSLYQLLPDTPLAVGILAIGVAPSEITSAFMTLLGGGNLALSTRVMAFSIFLSTFLAPLWLGVFLGKSVPLDLSGMVVELGLIIILPFIIASGLRTRYKQLEKYETEAGSLSALAVILLIFVVGGSIADYTLNLEVVWIAVACLVFNLGGYLLGFGLAFFSKRQLPETVALIFTSGMREFGIATALALNFLPKGASLAPAIYGLIMMVSASALATFLKNKEQNPVKQLA
jgi:BASS family bile acid:Na+ symporter